MNVDPRSRLGRTLAFIFAFGLVALPAMAAVAAVAYVAVARRRRRFRDTKMLVLIGVTGGISVLASPQPSGSLLPWLDWLVIGASFVLLAQRWDTSYARYAGLGLGLAALVAFGSELTQRFALGIDRPTGFAVVPNFEAGLMLALIGAVAATAPLYSSAAVRRLMAFTGLIAAGSLILTGSRGAVLGLMAGVLAWAFATAGVRWLPKVLPWAVILVAVVVAAAAVHVLTRPGGSHNAVRDSGFEHGTAPWLLGPGTRIVDLADGIAQLGHSAASLSATHAGYQVLLRYRPFIAVEPSERLTLSLWVRPEGGQGLTFARVEALRADGTFVARASQKTWTSGEEGRAGGYLDLPNGPVGKWRRVSYTLPPVPVGASWVTFMVSAGTSAPELYGEVDAFQLERGTIATSYVPGATSWLSGTRWPLLHRWLALDHPAAATGGRLTMWRFGLRLASHRPLLGYGPGSEVPLVTTYNASHTPLPLDHLHSFYLKMLVEGGALSLAALVAFLWTAGRRLVLRARTGSAAAAAALATLIALLVQSIFDPILSQPFIVGVFWMAVCTGLYTGEDDGSVA